METTVTNVLIEMSRFTAQAFVNGLWQGLLLTAAVALGLRLLPRVSASVRFAVWGFAFALVMLTPMLQMRTAGVAGPHAASVVRLGAVWGIAIAAIWMALMVARSAQLLRQAMRLRRIWRRATPVAVDSAMDAILRKSGRVAELCTSTDVDAPSVIGFFAPRLLIPEWLFEKVTDAELRQIVLHECEHLRRGDDWINLLQKIGMALFPLNPALLWVDRQLSLERELACDAGVVASTAAPFDYAHCLTRLAEHRMGYRNVALSLSAWSRKSELARRVHSLLRPMGKMSALQVRASVALLSFGLTGGAIEMARAPRFVSFADVVAAPSTPVADVAPMMSATGVVKATPVIYRQAEQPHATLLKAVVPAAKKPRAVAAPEQMVRRVNAERVSEGSREVLTMATQDSQDDREEIRPVYRMSTDFSPSYAAIPFGDGWLIVQL